MKVLSLIANTFRMTDEAWRRHANPWSVYTRFAAIPAMILAIWSRVWIGWWALVPVAVVIIWLLLNPHIFPADTTPRSWAARGIYGEKLWLLNESQVPEDYRVILRWLIALGSSWFVLLCWGLLKLLVWPSVFVATLIVVAQVWRIVRMGLVYE